MDIILAIIIVFALACIGAVIADIAETKKWLFRQESFLDSCFLLFNSNKNGYIARQNFTRKAECTCYC